MKSYLIFVIVSAFCAVSFAKSKPCKKGGEKDMENCLASAQIKWAYAPPADLTPEKILAGPDIKDVLSSDEKESGVVFCQFYFHEFSSPGSAKFLCAKTNEEGVLLDKKGTPVPEAKSVSTRPMNLSVQLNGSLQKVDEGVLLDANAKPLIKLNKANKEEFIKAAELKVKYFIDQSQTQESGVKRESVQLPLKEKLIKLDNVFTGPEDITVGRWNEVFTEVASTRLFWALGLPADVMIPVKKLVCYGCEAHAKNQSELNLARISIYQNVVLEKKYEGVKLGEQFSLNKVNGRYYPDYKPEQQHDYEALVLAAQLIAYHHAIALQNRMVCANQAYDKEKNICTEPVAFVQDVGSSWGGSKEGDNRGILALYQQGKVFSNAANCELFYPFGSSRIKESFVGPFLNDVSGEGVEKFKQRISHLTPDLMRALFTVSRYGDMQPTVRDAAPGASADEKRRFVIEKWVETFMQKLAEIKATKCHRAPRFPSSEDKVETAGVESDMGAKKMKSKDFRKYFKNVNPAERIAIISKARVLNESYDAATISKINMPEFYQQTCGPQFKYEKINVKGKITYKWPRVECQYHQDDGGLSGASSKFLCDFADPDKKDGLRTLKVKYSRIGVDPTRKAEVIDSTMASTLTRMLGFYAETYCLAEVVCKNCPSQSPWDEKNSSMPPGDKDYVFPLTMIEYPIKAHTVTNPKTKSMPQGVHWDEIKNIDGGELSRQMRIEREAWMLWVGVIQHWDADPHNQRISCIQSAVDADGNPYCEKSILYTHDYGRSFYRNFQFTLWSMTQPMKEDSRGCISNFGKMLFNGNPGPGIVQYPYISAEARDLLVERLSRLTDEQFIDIYRLSKGEEYVGKEASSWLKVFREKIAQMKEANCSAFASGQSVLGK